MATSSTGEKVLEVETLREELVRAKNIQGDLEQIVDAYEEKVQNVSKQLATNEEQLATSEERLATTEERLKGVLPQHCTFVLHMMLGALVVHSMVGSRVRPSGRGRSSNH